MPSMLQPKELARHAGLILVVGAAIGLLSFLVLYFWISFSLPKIDSLADYKPPIVTQIVSAEGELMAEYFKERRYVVPLEEVPKVVIDAFLASEDSTFFSHSGINFARIIGAMIENIKAGHIVQGASTITQQVAKTMLLTSAKTWSRKIREVILASRIERTFSKEQILYLYLNQIFLGHSSYGVEAASRTFFRKSVKDVTLPEAALIAGMPQAPSRYDPFKHPEAAKRRQAYVLTRMVDDGRITRQQANDAYQQPLYIYSIENTTRTRAPHYSEFVRRYLVQTYGEESAYTEGYIVHTACKLALQKPALDSMRQGLHELDQRQGFRGALGNLTKDKWEAFFRGVKIQSLQDEIPYQVIPGRTLGATEVLADGATPPEEDSVLKLRESEINDKDIEFLQKRWFEALGKEAQAIYAKVGKTPIVPKKLYKALVTQVEAKQATVRVGDIEGKILIENTRWARKPNPDQFWEWTPTMSFAGVLKTGDMVWASLKTLTAKEVIFYLDQEPLVEGALFSMEVPSGHVETMIGGYNFNRSEFNRAVQAMRQAGSTFKPIIYAAGLDKGLTPSTIIVDSPVTYRDEDAEFIQVWKPDNFGEKFYGDTTYRDALINSRNIPTIKIVQELGVPYILEFARHLGVTTPLNNDLSLSLGSSSVYLHEMIQLYSIFANQGRRVRPIFIKRILDRHQSELLNTAATGNDPSTELIKNTGPTATPPADATAQNSTLSLFQSDDPEQRLSPQTAYIMTNLLKGVVEEGTARAVRALGVPTAGKTGTTNEYIDAWFFGYTKHLVSGVWTGFDEVRTLGRLEVGGRSALPIWLTYMKEAVKGRPVEDFTLPPDITQSWIDAETGKVAGPRTKTKFQAAFKNGTLPGQPQAVPFLSQMKDLAAKSAASPAGATGTPSETPEETESDSREDFYRKEMEL